ncbi:glucanase B [Tothia fuscella]|uniref:Glucanase B n=1 Tax=Tothia fuscella TaxID=1048955 RepID=A0A9P4NFI4_9PEZI|nr:glucanase B [Tothia fuscella]
MTTKSTLTVGLKNATTSNVVYAYITGYAIDRSNHLLLMSSDGVTPYYPISPPGNVTVQPLNHDISIRLGPPNSTIFAEIPHIAGARVYFSVNNKLKFFLNPGPALVEPSCTNRSDANADVCWAFAELTFNDYQVFANISYVDFVSLPMSCEVETVEGRIDRVSGMALNGFDNVCRGLKAQSAKDGQPWERLIINNSAGRPFRVLSPNNGIVGDPTLFANYFRNYVDAVFEEYSTRPLNVNTQAQWRTVQGRTITNGSPDNGADDEMDFGEGVKYGKPSSKDIFSCSSGVFGDSVPLQLAVTPRLCAGFNRGTLLSAGVTPDPLGPGSFYKGAICNHYARILHEQLLDGRGYAFPYDDVCADGGPDQCGAVYDSYPKVLTFAVGGNGAWVDKDAFGAPKYD